MLTVLFAEVADNAVGGLDNTRVVRVGLAIDAVQDVVLFVQLGANRLRFFLHLAEDRMHNS